MTTKDDLLKLGRDGMIKVALEQMKVWGTVDMATFKMENFNRINVKVGREKVKVEFRMVPVYISLNTCMCYGATLFLTDSFSTFDVIENPEGCGGFDKVRFFNPTKETRKATAFITKAIKKRFEDPILDFRAYEAEDHYNILIETARTHSGYKISKRWGKVYDEWHKHLKIEPDPEEDEGFVDLE